MAEPYQTYSKLLDNVSGPGPGFRGRFWAEFGRKASVTGFYPVTSRPGSAAPGAGNAIKQPKVLSERFSGGG